jgi:hypothetical protein
VRKRKAKAEAGFDIYEPYKRSKGRGVAALLQRTSKSVLDFEYFRPKELHAMLRLRNSMRKKYRKRPIRGGHCGCDGEPGLGLVPAVSALLPRSGSSDRARPYGGRSWGDRSKPSALWVLCAAGLLRVSKFKLQPVRIRSGRLRGGVLLERPRVLAILKAREVREVNRPGSLAAREGP